MVRGQPRHAMQKCDGSGLTLQPRLAVTPAYKNYFVRCMLITSAEGGYVFTSVGLFVCRFVRPSDNWKRCERILTKFLWGVGHGPGTNEFNFGDDPDHCPDPGDRSPKSAFTALSKKLPTDFDEILRRAGVWPRDQLFTFWWWSASLSGSGSPFQITIRIHPGRTATILLCWRSARSVVSTLSISSCSCYLENVNVNDSTKMEF